MVVSTAAHDFTICSKSKPVVNIESISLVPDTPVIGNDVNINIQAIATKSMSTSLANLTISSFGIQILKENIDICAFTPCPIT